MSEFKIGDRVRIRPVPQNMDSVVVGQEGTVAGIEDHVGFQIRVRLDVAARGCRHWWFAPDELEHVVSPEILASGRAAYAEYVTKDSGNRETFGTGSVRDTREGKGRYDLLPPEGIRRVAQLYERGAAKYSDRNWEKGQPLSRLLDSGIRHAFAVLEGKDDEDHAAAVIWNFLAYITISERIQSGALPDELDDRGTTNG